MSSSYSTHQNWVQSQPQYTQGSLQLEQEYGYGLLPAGSSTQEYDSPYSYSPSDSQSSVGVNGSRSLPMTNANGGYMHSSTSARVSPFGANPPSNQSVPTAGSFVYTGFSSPSGNPTSNDHVYPTQYTSQNNANLTYDSSASYSIHNNSSIPLSNLTISDDNPPLVPGAYMSNPPVAGQNHTQLLSQTTSYYQPTGDISESGQKAKRQRSQMSGDLSDDQEADLPELKEGAKPKQGACSRCKTLKVKCEFRTETDPCKRCLNSGHDCVIPGRKKRRTPPKREHLLNQIREQAAQIERLMAQLETTNRNANEPSETPDLLSPIMSPTAATFSMPANGNRSMDGTPKAVADWLAKAKASLGAFGDHIDMAGASMPKNLLAGDEEDEVDEYDDGYYTVDDEEDAVSISVELPDGRSPAGSQIVRNKGSASSLNANDAGLKKPVDKGAIIPTKAAPFGLFGEMSLKKIKQRGGSVDPEEQEDKITGIASENFFRSISAPDNLSNRLSSSHAPPHILARGIISVQEAEKLFKIYFDSMNLSVSLLDPVLYSAPNTYFRSPFLFTVICAIASRFYSERPDLYQQAMHYAQLAAGTALISGRKDVDMCHAFILLSLYPVPAKRWEDQRSWLYLGLAIRTATELNLHLPVTSIPESEMAAREVLNRARVWLNCFNLDRSTGAQYGKPPTINSMDYQANHSQDWWRSSPYNMRNFDIQLCVYNHELRVTSGFISKIFNDPENPTGLNRNADFEGLAAATDDELKSLRERWFEVLEQNTDPEDYQNKFRTGLLKLAYSYGRLIVLSYGFQHAFGKNNTDENPFLMRCLCAAEDVVHAVVNDICGDPKMRHYWRHGPEAQSVFITFASAFLVKLLQPKFASYLTQEKRIEIRNKVQGVIDLLSSSDIAIDDRHGPKLYARFLKGLLAAPMARLETQSPTHSVSSLPRNHPLRKARSAGMSPGSEAASSDSFGAVRTSLSPPPNQAALSFDSFAPMGGASDPFAPGPSVSGASMGTTGVVNQGMGANAIGLSTASMADLFQPPLQIDTQIMDNLQSLSDATSWSSYNWLSHYQNLQQNFAMDLRSAGDMMMQTDGQFS